MDRRFWMWLVFVALLAGTVRFYRLGHGVLRGDELNRYMVGRSPISLIQYWREWPPANQIPLQEVFSMGLARWMGDVNEFTLRLPGAVLGWLTVLGLTFWVGWRWGTAAGILAGIWLALNPYHMHESRESYFYGFLMFHAALFSVYTLEAITRLRARGRAMGWGAFAGWSVTAILMCMSHMSSWVLALVWGGALLAYGWTALPPPERHRQLIRLAVSGLFILFMMRRWISDAIGEVRKVSQDDGYVYIGDSFAKVAPRVVPMYLAGYNGFGWLLVALVAAGAYVLWRCRRDAPADPRYALLTLLTLASTAALYAYIGLVGGGVAKETFFSSVWPVLVPWAAVTLWKAAGQLPSRLSVDARQRVFTAFTALMFLVLAVPAWVIMNLDGKPTPYRQIREWLDTELPAGTVVVVDRWLEPWNEMAIYAPSNVFVTFTIPDEPFEQYVEGDWRGVTRQAFESGDAQAFLRLARNQEARMGVWEFPERFFKRRAEIANERALWLRRTGFSPISGLYDANTNRTVVHVFYNTDEDWSERARNAGRNAWVRYGRGWEYLKPWRGVPGWPEPWLQTLWIQAGIYQSGRGTLESLEELYRLPQSQAMRDLNQGRWADYRIPGEQAQLQLFNVTDRELRQELRITGMAMTGPVTTHVGDQTVTFPAGLLATKTVPLVLMPGKNSVEVSIPADQVLLVRRVAL